MSEIKANLYKEFSNTCGTDDESGVGIVDYLLQTLEETKFDMKKSKKIFFDTLMEQGIEEEAIKNTIEPFLQTTYDTKIMPNKVKLFPNYKFEEEIKPKLSLKAMHVSKPTTTTTTTTTTPTTTTTAKEKEKEKEVEVITVPTVKPVGRAKKAPKITYKTGVNLYKQDRTKDVKISLEKEYNEIQKLLPEDKRKPYISNNNELVKLLTAEWKGLPEDKRQEYEKKAIDMNLSNGLELKGKAKDINKPKGPLSSFMMFSQIRREEIKAKYKEEEITAKGYMTGKTLGEEWKNLSKEDQEKYKKLADEFNEKEGRVKTERAPTTKKGKADDKMGVKANGYHMFEKDFITTWTVLPDKKENNEAYKAAKSAAWAAIKEAAGEEYNKYQELATEENIKRGVPVKDS